MSDDLEGCPLCGVNLLRSRGIEGCPVVSSTEDVARVFEDMAILPKRVWIAGSLDLNFRLLSWNIIGEGITPVIRPIDAFAGAILNSTKSIFVVRNTSEGEVDNSTPLHFDRCLLKRLQCSAHMMGYTLVDYVILSKNSGHSILDVRRSETSTRNRLKHVPPSSRPSRPYFQFQVRF